MDPYEKYDMVFNGARTDTGADELTWKERWRRQWLDGGAIFRGTRRVRPADHELSEH
jgi:hypothetical protein